MKHWGIFAIVVVAGIAAIVVAERRHVDVSPDPAPLVYLVADTEQELTRMPVQFTRMSDDEEIRIGNQLAESYNYGEQANKSARRIEIENYLKQVGTPLAARAHRKLPYRFHYVEDPYFINAFALPGGHVFVGEGLLALMDSEDELANILGHEIEHIDHYHCAERVQQEQALRKIPFGDIFSMPISIFEAGYSKDQELEADREGTRLAVQAGYSPSGAIRMFETFQRLYEENQRRALTPEQELSDVAMQTLEGYFRSHPQPSERIQQIQTLIASENWPVRAEWELQIAYLYYTSQAQQAYAEHKYDRAEQLANRSLKVHADDPDALKVLAEAQFAQANFSAAADSYRSLLKLRSDNEIIRDFAWSLAAVNRENAAAEFKRWASTSSADAFEIQIQQAGLFLIAGDSTPAKNVLIDAAANEGEHALPVVKGQIGWWYYHAGDYDTASTLLEQAYQERPEDGSIILHSAWALVEQKRYADALNRLDSINNYSQQKVSPSAQMALHAVVKWQMQLTDASLADFISASAEAPEWKNSKWVKALYSPFVYQSVEAIKAEAARREKLRLASSRH